MPTILSIGFGLYALFRARFPLFAGRIATGRRARFAGVLLLMYLPLTFVAGFVFGLYSVLVAGVPTGQLAASALTYQYPIALVSIAIDVGLAYWVAYTAPQWGIRRGGELVMAIPLNDAAQRLGMTPAQVMMQVEAGLLELRGNRAVDPRILEDGLSDLRRRQLVIGNELTSDELAIIPSETRALISEYSAFIMSNITNADLCFQRGKLYNQVDQKARAAIDFRRVLALQANYAYADDMRRYIDRWGTAVPIDQAAFLAEEDLRIAARRRKRGGGTWRFILLLVVLAVLGISILTVLTLANLGEQIGHNPQMLTMIAPTPICAPARNCPPAGGNGANY